MGIRLIDRTQQVTTALREQVARGINNACQMWVDEAVDLAPEDTGFLKDHVTQSKAATASDLSGEVRSLAWYSGWVNGGTSKQAAQPFWTVAGLLVREKFEWLLKSGFVAISRGSSVGGGVMRGLMELRHNTYEGSRSTRIHAFGGGLLRRGGSGRFTGVSHPLNRSRGGGR